ncbi:hypothetical protein BDV93DRAFT_562503 [Ceratobasidium sp. AG-I]|nr:hypothetical protein BDV93DRAFT_562503 [Ceratobasidium sp. AG-I]
METTTQRIPAIGSTNGPKYIIVFCDGTGKDGVADNPAIHTNVYRLYQQVEKHANGPPVTVGGSTYSVMPRYFPGIGSRSKGVEKYLGQVFGMKIVNMVAEVYLWIAENYRPGDHVCLFGYSRGAFVARKVAGLLHHVGLTTKKTDLLRQWRNHETAIPWAKSSESSKIPIKYLGVWDTVGAVYSPMVSVLKDTMGISDEDLPPNVLNALHVVAFHENRKRFAVTLFKKKENHDANLQEVWFPGARSDVGGGGDKPTDLPNISLQWMMGKVDVFAKPLKKFEVNYTTASLIPQDAYDESAKYKQVIDQKQNRLNSGHLTATSMVHEAVRYLENSSQTTPRPCSLITLEQLRERVHWDASTHLVPFPSVAKQTKKKSTWSFVELCQPIATSILSHRQSSIYYCHVLPEPGVDH